MFVKAASSWSALTSGFRWQVPGDFNIAHIACDRWAFGEPERVCVLKWNGNDLEPFTYGWLAEQSRRLANALAAQGVRRGDRIGLLLPQSPEVVVAHMAAYRMGAIAIPLASLFGPDALEYRLGFSGTRALVTDSAGLAKVGPIRDKLPDLAAIFCVDGAAGDALDFHQSLANASSDFDRVETTPDTPALMVFTSGTTGPPKGALHGHKVLAGHIPAVQVLHEFAPQRDDRFWTPADWAWAGGLLNIMLPALALGIPVVAHAAQKFDPEAAFEMMGRAQVRNVFIPPTALKIMKSVERPRERFGMGLRTLFSGGEALGKETFEWGKSELGITINEGYGQTECNLVLTSCAALGVNRAGSAGRPTPGNHVAVIREDGTICDVNEPGQIAVKRPLPTMFLEYWLRPEATAEKFIGDWMTTGDQALTDEDGYFHFVGRDDDIITSAGFRIGPGEIEDCLIAHPAVRLAAAVGKPDGVRTEIVKCYVMLEEGQIGDEALKADIKAYVRSRLSAHEYPREIDFVDAMPLTTTGKVIRREFRDRAKQEADL
ncbi:AMP-binding protein [Pseudahrensia aquimaris]|uniref:AMP-binding protein n=1 Tax=Pseudahrensia aquimaris TaxID=744461 RepID=A0ABW3F923_9HYPH